MSIIATESGRPWRRAPLISPLEPGEHVAAVEQPGERVLVEHRLEPPALADELLLERLGAGGGAHAGEHLGGRDRLDQQVVGAAREQLLRLRERHLLGATSTTAVEKTSGCGLELVEQRAAARRLDALAHQRDVGLVPLAGMPAPAPKSAASATSYPTRAQRRGSSRRAQGSVCATTTFTFMSLPAPAASHRHTDGCTAQTHPPQAAIARASCTSRCICSTSASTVSKRRSPRSRARNASRSSRS